MTVWIAWYWIRLAAADVPDSRRRIRRASLVVMFAAYAVAVGYDGSLVTLLLSAYGAVVQFAPAVLATLYWERATGPAVLAAMVAGSAVTVAFVIAPDARPWAIHAGAYGLVVNVVVLVLGSVLPGRDDGAPDEEFLATARR